MRIPGESIYDGVWFSLFKKTVQEHSIYRMECLVLVEVYLSGSISSGISTGWHYLRKQKVFRGRKRGPWTDCLICKSAAQFIIWGEYFYGCWWNDQVAFQKWNSYTC